MGFGFDGEAFLVGGAGLARTLKYRNVRAGSRVALAMDDRDADGGPRGLKVHGSASIVALKDGREAIRVEPVRSWSWGIEEPAFRGSEYVLARRTFETR